MRFSSYAPCTIQRCRFFFTHSLAFFRKVFDLIHLPYPYFRHIFFSLLILLKLSSSMCTLFLSLFSCYFTSFRISILFLCYTFSFYLKKLHSALFFLHLCLKSIFYRSFVVSVAVCVCSLRSLSTWCCYRKRCSP